MADRREAEPPATLVTGAARGIGAAIATHLLAEGGRVLAFDADWSGSETPQASEDRLVRLTGDVASETDVEAAVERCIADFGRLDGLVCNAGVMVRKPLAELSSTEWHRVLDVNLTQAFLFAKAAGPHLKRSGRGAIVLMSSTRAFMSEADTEAYSATKGGLFALAHALSISLRPQVRVNAIAPGWIDTSGDALRAVDHEQHPAGRVGRPADVAEACAFLLDAKRSGFVTGETLVIDGGMTRKMIYAH